MPVRAARVHAVPAPADDLSLLTAVRLGDVGAYGELYGRHASAARAFAHHLVGSGAEADDVVAESFAKVLERLCSGTGPCERFRPYLFRTIRNDVYDRARRASRLRPSEGLEDVADEVAAVDAVEADLEHRLVSQAYASLPDRWRRTLWHTAVEGLSPLEVAGLLGSTTTNVTSLAHRARERLRQAYLDGYLAEQGHPACDQHVRRLGAFVRDGLGGRAAAATAEHLRSCRRCHQLAEEVREVSTTMRGRACRAVAPSSVAPSSVAGATA